MFHKSITPIGQCQLKFASEGEGKFEGYLSVFNSTDQIGDTILPGAYTKSLEKTDIYPLFVNHKHDDVPVGVLKARQDNHGLIVAGEINPDHHMAKTVYSAIKLGHMRGMSIGYTVPGGGWKAKDDSGGRILTEVNLKEGSIVTFPCEESAVIVAVKKSDIDQLLTIRDIEGFMRDACGLSKSAGVALMARCRDVFLREAEQKMRESLEQKELLDALRALNKRI